LGLSCKKAAYLEHYLSLYVEKVSRSICHGRTRNYTEKTEAETRKKEKAEAEALTRNYTELHGNKAEDFATEIRTSTSRRLCHGLTRNYTEISRSRDMEKRKDRSRSICHGRTRNFTEKTEAETRKKEKTEAEAFATD
jgi:hypothetical protein